MRRGQSRYSDTLFRLRGRRSTVNRLTRTVSNSSQVRNRVRLDRGRDRGSQATFTVPENDNKIKITHNVTRLVKDIYEANAAKEFRPTRTATPVPISLYV